MAMQHQQQMQAWQQQYYQQMQRQRQAQQQAQPQQAGGGAGCAGDGGGREVGAAQRFNISGCTHDVVGPIIRGDYALAGSNHGKPAYKKDTTANGVAVLVYYWDERDGASGAGWWIGPQVGGNMVWGHHPDRTSATPPLSGWQAPHSTPADPSIVVTVATGQQQAWQQQQGWQQQQNPAMMQQQQMAMMQQQQQMQMQQQAAMQQRNMQQQQMMQQRQQMEEANRQRMVEQRRMQEEMQKKRFEDQRQKMEAMRQQQMEIQVAATIRKSLWRLKAATPENFDDLKEEMAKLLAEELEKCGAQQGTLREESDKALEDATKKVEATKEVRAKEEAARLEAERKRAEAVERAAVLWTELRALVDVAGEAAKEFQDARTKLESADGLDSKEKVDAAARPVEEAGKEAADKVQACTEFMRDKAADLRFLPLAVPKPPKAEEPKAEKEEGDEEEPKKEEGSNDTENAATQQTFQKVQMKLSTLRTTLDKETRSLKHMTQVAKKKAAALTERRKVQTLFAKFDKDKDQVLNKREISVFAKTEYQFTISEEDLATMLQALLPNGEKGVKLEDFQALKVAVGVARERAKDKVRRADREAKEQELVESKNQLQKGISEVGDMLHEVEQMLGNANKIVRDFQAEAKDMTSGQMLARAAEVDEVTKSASSKIPEGVEKVEGLGGEVPEELKRWFEVEKRRLTMLARTHEAGVARLVQTVDRLKLDAARKEALEVRAAGDKAMAKLKRYQAEKKMSAAAIFDEIKKAGEGFDESEFVAYISGLAGAEGEEEMAEEELGRAFKAFDDDGLGTISKASFEASLMVLMKVMKDVALTEMLSIKDSKAVRRLICGEAVQLLEGPVREDTAEVDRVRVRCMEDGKEGWVSVAGNQGSAYLREGIQFKVVKETLITESFDIEAPKDEARKVNMVSKKLKPGDILDLREWGRTHEETGLTRLKCKVRSDGTVGYVTSVGNTGIKFVEMI